MRKPRKLKDAYCGYYDHADCFLRGMNGICKGLRDTDFGDRDCPFYKDRRKVREEENENDMVSASGERL